MKNLIPQWILFFTLTVLQVSSFAQSSKEHEAQSNMDTTAKHHCTVGYAMGNAVNDGRAIIWRNYDWDNAPHVTNLIDNNYETWLNNWGTYRWIGTSQESWFVFGGLNEKGLGCFNSLLLDFATEGNYNMGNYRPQAWILANCKTIAEVRQGIQEQIDFNNGAGGVDHGWNWGPTNNSPALSLVVIDANGQTSLFEIAKTFYYEYDPTTTNRLNQFPIQVGARANEPHRNTDHTDTPGTDYQATGGRRYYEARDHLLQEATDGDFLSIQEVMDTVSRWGNPGYDGSYTNCLNSNYSTMDATIIWGAAAGEDPRTATLFIALGNPDYSAFVPVWPTTGSMLSDRLNKTTSQGIGSKATDLYGKRVDINYDDYINTFFTGMEENFREVVTDVREYWNTNGFDVNMADAITDEAAETVYQALVSLNVGSGYNLNPTPTLTAINTTITNFDVDFTATSSDDGAITSFSWDFGDGTTSSLSSPSHMYTNAGSYLVRVTVEDNDGSRNTKWKFIDVPNTTTCSAPTVPTITYDPTTICNGNDATLSISGNLNDATEWKIYTGLCGETEVGSTTNDSIIVSPASPSTTYYVRGEGGCVTPSSCGNVTLNVLSALTGTDVQTGCNNYIWIDGNTYTSSNNTATHILTATNGCDSVVTLNLTITTVDTLVTNTSPPTLTANQSGANYHWLDCNNNNAVIFGETNQNYTPTSSGSYAVEVTNGSCIDSSACYNVVVSSVVVPSLSKPDVHPNPTKSVINITLNSRSGNVNYLLSTIEGKIIKQEQGITDDYFVIDLSKESKGVYLLQIRDNQSKKIYKIIKE
ncbi:MAG: PKD domain-containing protein [Vicingus serpentipes]|nr:PKD domain-containing protein [Vicingus serpentipes]